MLAVVVAIACGVVFTRACTDPAGSPPVTAAPGTMATPAVTVAWTTTTQTTTTQTTTTTLAGQAAGSRNRVYRPVKGLYLTAYTAGNDDALARLVEIADETEVNAFVIDIKDSSGYLLYEADVPVARLLGLVEARIADVDALVAMLERHGIIPIARLVCFQDTALAERLPDMAVKSQATGGNWLDRKKAMYLDPYNRQVWEYLTEIAEDAARHGFREIQFDYVRFPSDGPLDDAVYPSADASKEDAIAGFLAFARARLKEFNVWVSADVFGVTLQVDDDAGIGQKLEKVAANVDIVCPMIYPSHYSNGSYGLANPNARPYELITAALRDLKAKLPGTGATGRPWLQAFTLGSPPYGADEIRAEIEAVADQGLKEWILWSPGNKYPVSALAPE